MSKSKLKVQKGLAYVITTGEPVFVKGFGTTTNLFGDTETVAYVVRPVLTQLNGIEYRKEELPLEELETRYEQAKRNTEFEQSIATLRIALEEHIKTLRIEAEEKRYALPQEMKKALTDFQAQNPSKPIKFEGVDG